MKPTFLRLSAAILMTGIISFYGCTKTEPTASPIPASSPQPKNKIDLVQQAREHLEGGDFARAINSLKAAVSIDPKNTEAHLLFARTWMHLKNYEEAIGYFNTVIRLQPDNGDAYLLLGGCYDLMGNRQKAIEEVERSIEIFREQRDRENFKRAMAVLQGLKSIQEQNQPS